MGLVYIIARSVGYRGIRFNAVAMTGGFGVFVSVSSDIFTEMKRNWML